MATAVEGSADLSVTKADSPGPVTAGNPLTYTITVSNGGPSTATGVKVTDSSRTARPSSRLSTATAPPSAHCADRNVVCRGVDGARNHGDDLLTVTVDPSLPPTAVLANTATVSSPTPDPDPPTTPRTRPQT